ncbi:thioredoxin family protein [bacterium]|nr:thioredoxin family protein [bacterium]
MKKIEVLGIGCPNCKKTEAIIRQVVEKKGWTEGQEYVIEKVTNPSDIAARGILATPGVVVDGVVKHSGKIPSQSMIEGWIG